MIVKKNSFVGVAVFFTFAITFIASGNSYPVVVVHYVSVLAVFLVVLLAFITRLRFLKIDFYIFLMLGAWLLFPLFFLNSSMNKMVSFLDICYTLLVVISAIFFAKYYSADKVFFEKFLFYFAQLFVVTNCLAYLFWWFGYFSYATSDFSGVFNNRNILAVASTFLLIGLLNVAWNNFSFLNIFYRLMLIVFVTVFVVVSASTKGLIGLVLVFTIYFFYPLKIKNIILGGLVGLVLIGFITSTEYGTRSIERLEAHALGMLDSDAVISDRSAGERKWLRDAALELSRGSFYTGIGMKNSPLYLISPYREHMENQGTYSHVNYLEVILNGGVFALLIYYFPLLVLAVALIFVGPQVGRVKMALSFISLVLINDLAMVSYNLFIVKFFLACCFYIYIFDALRAVRGGRK